MKRKVVKNVLFSAAMAANIAVLPPGTVYGATGQLLEGTWRNEETGWRHYDVQGNRNTGWIQKESGWYYLRPEDGVMVTGLQKIDGQYYYFETAGDSGEIEGRMRSGWQKLPDGNWYFFNTLHDGNFGAMKTGWQWIDGYCYYFGIIEGSDYGRMYSETATPDGYYVNGEGKWAEINGGIHFESGRGLPSLEGAVSQAGSSSGGSSDSGAGGSSFSSGHGENNGGENSSGSENEDQKDENSGQEGEIGDHENEGSEDGGTGGADSGTVEEGSGSGTEEGESGDPDSGQEEQPQETVLVDEERTKLVNLGWVQYAVIAFQEGTIDDHTIEVDGTDITAACTNVDDDGAVVKWQTTVWDPGIMVVTRGSDGEKQEVKLGNGTAAEAPDEGDPESAPVSILTNGAISVFDYHLDNYDSNGNVRVKPEKTTFDLSGEGEDASSEIPAGYYVQDTEIDTEGKGNIEIKLSLAAQEQGEWFDQLARIKALNTENNILNDNLTFTTEKDGNTGTIHIRLPQTNLFSRGRYQLNLSSSYSGETMNVPIHLVDGRNWIVNLNSLNPSPKTGECFAFDIVGEDGSSFGTEILSPIYRVDLEKPSGEIVSLQEIDEWYEIGSMLHICGTDPDGNVITDEECVYTVTIYADGYRTMSKKVEIGSTASNAGSEAVTYRLDAIASASLVIPDEGDSEGSEGGGSLGGPQMNAFLVFDHDLLSNALILEEIDYGNDDSEAVAQWWYDQSPEAVMDNEAETFYDFTHYLNAVQDEKLENGGYLTFEEYKEIQQGGETANRPSQIKRVLEDGKLGSVEDLASIVGKDAPVLYGTEGKLGEDLTLTCEADAEYISRITGLYLDGSSQPLRADDYITNYKISEDQTSLVILYRTEGQIQEIQLTAGEHKLLITADGYKEQTATLTVSKDLEEFELSLAENPERDPAEEPDAYHAGQPVLINAAAEEMELENPEVRGDFLRNLTGVELTDPAGETKHVLPQGQGGLYSEDSYVKNDYTIMLQKNLFKEAGEYTVTLTAEGYRAKTLTFEILESVKTPDEDGQTIEFERAELAEVESFFGNYEYYRISFKGAEDKEIADLLSTIEEVAVDGISYEKALLGLDADDANAYHVGPYDSVQGGAYKYLQLKPAEGFEAGEHTVVVSFEEAADLTFIFETDSEEIPEEEEMAPPAAKDSIYEEAETFSPAHYRISFDVSEDEGALKNYALAITDMTVNGQEYERDYNLFSAEYAWVVQEAEGGYGIYSELCLTAEAFTEDVNEVVIEAEGYEALTLKIRKDGSLASDDEEIPGEEGLDAPEFDKIKLAEAGWFEPEHYEISFKGMDEEALDSYLKEETLQVLVNETEFFNASGISYADPGDFAIGKNDAYGNYETLQFLAEDLSDGDIIRVEVEGYQTLEFEISLSETVNSVLLIEEIEKAPEELIDEEILDEDLIKGEITDEAAGEDTANEDTKGEKDDIEEEKSEESGAEGEIPDSEEPAEEEPAEEEPTEEELPEKEPADSETADSETADSEATDSEVADSEAGDDEIAAEEVAEDDAAGEGSADGEIAAEGVAGEETVNEEIAGKEPVDEEIADDEVADEDIAADGGESEDFAEGKIPEEEISEEEILEEESEEAAEETASDEKTEQVDEEAVEDEASEEEAETEEIRQAADQI